MSWLEPTEDGVLIRIHAQPKASRSEVVCPHGDRMKIRIAAPPVDGEANEELVRFLKKMLKISASQLTLVRGQSSKMKDVLCAGLTVTEIEERLSASQDAKAE